MSAAIIHFTKSAVLSTNRTLTYGSKTWHCFEGKTGITNVRKQNTQGKNPLCEEFNKLKKNFVIHRSPNNDGQVNSMRLRRCRSVSIQYNVEESLGKQDTVVWQY